VVVIGRTQLIHANVQLIEVPSKQTLRSFGFSDQTADLMGATLGLATNKGAKLNLNESKTFAIELKDVATHDPALYFGYNLDW
jgi:hypothetical protein